jgi:hypothetical protein
LYVSGIFWRLLVSFSRLKRRSNQNSEPIARLDWKLEWGDMTLSFLDAPFERAVLTASLSRHQQPPQTWQQSSNSPLAPAVHPQQPWLKRARWNPLIKNCVRHRCTPELRPKFSKRRYRFYAPGRWWISGILISDQEFRAKSLRLRNTGNSWSTSWTVFDTGPELLSRHDPNVRA